MLNVSRQSINELVQRGVLPMGADGLIDVELARHAIANRVKPGAKSAAALAAPPAAQNPGTGAPPNGASAAETAAPATSYHVAKTLREAAEAQLAQLELAERRRELVKAEDVRRRAFEAARIARDMVLAVPARLAAILAAESDLARCHDILDAELRKVCDEISKGEGTLDP